MNDVNLKKLANLLGMAQRAGKLVSGESSVTKIAKTGKIKLLIIAEDVSDETAKMYHDMVEYHKIKSIRIFTKDELGTIIGKGYRAAVAVIDQGFAKAMSDIVKNK